MNINVKLVASEGSEFASVTVDDGVVLYVDGSAEAEPFAWFMGDKFAFRAFRDAVCDGCGSPVWKAEFFHRTFNGPGSELVAVHAAAGELADGIGDVPGAAVMVASEFGVELVGSLDPVQVAFGAAMGSDDALLVVWVAAVVKALEPLARPAFEQAMAAQAAQEAEAFASRPLG